ncbi:MAG: hybrid sensor histidine kinase/response regulator [Chloroflexota bacterium]
MNNLTATKQGQKSRTDQKTNQLTVLYIEDNLPNQKLVERILSRHNYNLILACDGLSGIRMAVENTPDLILVDINLPDMSGQEITASLKSKNVFSDTPIIALTADASEDNRNKALAVGCDGFLTKPIDVVTFPKQIAEFLQGKQEELPVERAQETLKTYVGELVGNLEAKVVELETANRKLRKLDTAKSNFIQLISHELRTPLTLLNGYQMLMADYIKRNPESEDALGNIRNGMAKGISRFSNIIQEVLSVSKITAATLNISKGPVRLDEAINDVVKEYEQSCIDRNIVIAVEDLSSLPVLSIDGDQIKIALSNIIGNAIKFTPNGGSIRIFPLTMNNSITIGIQDYGPGVPLKEQTNIFEAFYTLESIANHSTSKTQFLGGGLGLGLPIAKGIIEAHGGRVWVESNGRDMEKMLGSIFYILLPTK